VKVSSDGGGLQSSAAAMAYAVPSLSPLAISEPSLVRHDFTSRCTGAASDFIKDELSGLGGNRARGERRICSPRPKVYVAESARSREEDARR
jgi:hypothetical protein